MSTLEAKRDWSAEMASIRADRSQAIELLIEADLRAEEYRRRAFAMMKRVRELRKELKK